MKKLLTIFITLILTLFIAQQSFAVQADEDEREASASAGEMVGEMVDFDGLDSDTQGQLLNNMKRSGRSDEEHLAFLRSHVYQVSRDGENVLVTAVPAPGSRSTVIVSANHPSAQPYSNGNEVTVFTRQDVSSREVAIRQNDKGTSPATSSVNQPNALVTGEQAEGYRMRDVSSREVAIRPSDRGTSPATSSVNQPNALVTGEQAEGYRMRDVSSREVAIRQNDKGTSSGSSPNTVQYVNIGNDLDTNGAIASVNVSNVKTKSTFSEITISHFIPHAGVKIGVNNRKASESRTSGEGVLIASIVNSANNLLME